MSRNWPDDAAYERHKAEIKQMHAAYEAMDQEELNEFISDLDERDRERRER